MKTFQYIILFITEFSEFFFCSCLFNITIFELKTSKFQKIQIQVLYQKSLVGDGRILHVFTFSLLPSLHKAPFYRHGVKMHGSGLFVTQLQFPFHCTHVAV